jgi:predicted MFS family arabinose efflux permease
VEPTQEEQVERRWGAVAAYALLAASTQLLWLTYAPLTTASAHHYRVSETAIGWLAELFPLLYVVLAIPAGRLLDRSFHRWLAVGAVLTAAGGLVRLAGDDYAWALAGQVLVAIAQPLVLNAVTKVAAEYLPASLRPHGIAVGSAGIFGGMLLSLVLGTALGGKEIATLLVIQAAFAVLAALVLCSQLRRRGAGSPQKEAVAVGVAALRAVWADPGVRVMSGLLFLGFGAFIALTTWLQALLHHYHVSANAAGSLLVGMVLAGAIGSATLPPLLVRRRAERSVIAASIAVCRGGWHCARVRSWDRDRRGGAGADGTPFADGPSGRARAERARRRQRGRNGDGAALALWPARRPRPCARGPGARAPSDGCVPPARCCRGVRRAAA